MEWQVAFFIALYIWVGFKLVGRDNTVLETFIGVVVWPLGILAALYLEIKTLIDRQTRK